MRRMWIALLAVALVACETVPTAKPKGPTSEVERQVVTILAPSAQIVDQPFEDALALVDLSRSREAGVLVAERPDATFRERCAGHRRLQHRGIRTQLRVRAG